MQEELDKQNPIIDDIDTQLNRVTSQLKTNNAKLKGMLTQVRGQSSSARGRERVPRGFWPCHVNCLGAATQGELSTTFTCARPAVQHARADRETRKEGATGGWASP